MKNFEKYELSFDLDAIINDLCQKCDPFTDDEKMILKNMPKQYKWIARDKNGELTLYENKPERDLFYYVQQGKESCLSIPCYEHIFKNITFEGGAVCFRGDEDE